jgi:hypothetical protein
MSNDGVEIRVAGNRVAYDPTVHGDRSTDPIDLQVNAPGWYPIQVRYYQRKGTATLIFKWHVPGSDGFTAVPPTAYGHR